MLWGYTSRKVLWHCLCKLRQISDLLKVSEWQFENSCSLAQRPSCWYVVRGARHKLWLVSGLVQKQTQGMMVLWPGDLSIWPSLLFPCSCPPTSLAPPPLFCPKQIARLTTLENMPAFPPALETNKLLLSIPQILTLKCYSFLLQHRGNLKKSPLPKNQQHILAT